MMNYFSYLLPFLLCFAHRINAQQIDLSGLVSIHNSGYETGEVEYVKDVFVSAPFTSPDDTDVNGKFTLVFVGIKSGTSIQLSVEKKGFEVVNQRDLLDVVLGRKSAVRIFLATRGQLARAQTTLYNVSLAALTRRYDQTIGALRLQGNASQAAIQDLEQKIGRAISDRYEAEKILTEQLERLKQKLPEFSRQLASVNLDFASEMFRKAYAYFESGEIEKAIEVLDEAVLDKSAKEAVKNLEILEEQIEDTQTTIELENARFEELIKLLRLEGSSYKSQNDYARAIDKYSKAIALLDGQGRQDTVLARLHWEQSILLELEGAFTAALEQKLSALQIYETHRSTEDTTYWNVWLDIARVYEQTNMLEEAIIYYQKAYVLGKNKPVAWSKELESLTAHLVALLRLRISALEKQQNNMELLGKYQLLSSFELGEKETKRIKRKIKKLKSKMK